MYKQKSSANIGDELISWVRVLLILLMNAITVILMYVLRDINDALFQELSRRDFDTQVKFGIIVLFTGFQFIFLLIIDLYIIFLLDPSEKEKPPDERSFLRYYAASSKHLIQYYLILFISGALFLYGVITPEQTNMEPEITKEDTILFTNLPYLFSDPERGDIVYVDKVYINDAIHPNANAILVGRVVGLPGETVQISDGNLEIDCKYVPEQYRIKNNCPGCSMGRITLGYNEYFIAPDNRKPGNFLGWTVNRKNIWGKLMLINSGRILTGFRMPIDYSGDLVSAITGDSIQPLGDCKNSSLIFGPVSHALTKGYDNFVPTYRAFVDLHDFITEASFQNPNGNTTKWSYGFSFRVNLLSGDGYDLIVSNDKQWALWKTSGGDKSNIQGGYIDTLQIDQGDINDLRLIVRGNTGSFYVNGIYIADLDLLGTITKGDIAVIAGFYVGMEGGGSLYVDNFRVFELDTKNIGPYAGNLHQRTDGLVATYNAGIETRDFLAEATFINPYSTETGSWDYGFLFRSQDENGELRILVASDGSWLLVNWDGKSFTDIAKGTISNLNTGVGQENKLKLVCDGRVGKFYVNDLFVENIDLSAQMSSGKILISTGIISGNSLMGSVTAFRDFRIEIFDTPTQN